MTSARLSVANPSGLHARPAALFVRTAGRFRSRVTVANATTGKGPVDAKSILSVLTLGVGHGMEIEISADGDDAEAAIQGLRDAVSAGLGETLGEGV